MIIIKANNGGEVGNEGVGLPSTIVESSSEWSNDVSSEDTGKTTHEGGFSTSRVGGNSNDNGGFCLLIIVCVCVCVDV